MSRDKSKVSIIIPVYNIEKYLCKCLDSILAQTFLNFEVFLIDDGSTDNSGEICEEYAEKDNRLKVFHQKNQGVSVTRQRALNMVTTEFVAFIDPDDYVENDYLERLYETALKAKADLVWCDYVEHHSDKDCGHSCAWMDKSRSGLLKGILESGFSAVLWNKLYRTAVIKENGICFDSALKTAEDILFVSEFVCHSSTFAYVEKPLYHYNMANENSAINKFSTLKFKNDYAVMLSCLQPELKKIGEYEALYTALINCMFYCKDIYVFDSRYRDFKKYRNLFPEVDKHLDLLSGQTFFRKQTLRFVAFRLDLLGYGCLVINKIFDKNE